MRRWRRCTLILLLLISSFLVVRGAAVADDGDDDYDDDDDDRGVGEEEDGGISRRVLKPTGDNKWPLEVNVLKADPVADGVGREMQCVDVDLEIEVDCEEGLTCGCKSSSLVVRVKESMVVLRSRLDELMDVFGPDSMQVSLMLCNIDTEPEAASATPFYPVEVELVHSSKTVFAYACTNMSHTGQKHDCLTRSRSPPAITETLNSASISPGVTVEGVCRKGDDCSAPSPEILKAQNLFADGEVRAAIRSLEQLKEGNRAVSAVRAAFLPPLAIFARCCDSSNEMCSSMRGVQGGFARGGSDVEIHEVFGLDQCDGSFVELGAGDGVIDSATLLFEKNFGWKGLLVEADQGAYQELKRRSGRGASILHHVPQGKGGRDGDSALDKEVLSLKERAGEAIGLDGPQELSLLVVNQGSDGGAMKWLESFNFDAEATGYMEMVSVPSYIVAVQDGDDSEAAKHFLEGKSYQFQSKTTGGNGKGRAYNLFVFQPPMGEVEAEHMEGSSDSSGYDRNREVEVEYIRGGDDDDEEEEEEEEED